MVITDFLEDNARHNGSDIALVEVNPTEERDNAKTWREASLIESAAEGTPFRREITWRDFDRQSNRICNLLLSRNIKKGTKVGLLLMNCIEWLPIYFGILKAGCVAVPLNYRYSSEEIKYCLDLADCEVFIFGDEFVERVNNIIADIHTITTIFHVGKNRPAYAEDCMKLAYFCSKSASPVRLSETDVAAIYFSSGTTGQPKAIVHLHKALVASCFTEQENHGQTKDDVFLCIPPLYHTGAKMHWFGSLISCSKAVMLRGVKPEWILRTITEEKCSIVWLLVPWASDILDYIESSNIDLSHYLLDQWRLMHIGAQPVPPSLIKRWKAIFPEHSYDTNYGLSESLGPGCVHLGVENIDKVGAIGKPSKNWEAKIVDENNKTLSIGEVGELAVKGPGVMVEYYKNEEATKDVLVDGWLMTGDVAVTDESGFIYLVDRKKDVIISGGENIYPVQIENHMLKLDKIKDVAVIGLPDARLGEIAVAVVQAKDGAEITGDELDELCSTLPRYKRPIKYIFDDVPRNPTGKIEKVKLRNRYCKKAPVIMQIKS